MVSGQIERTRPNCSYILGCILRDDDGEVAGGWGGGGIGVGKGEERDGRSKIRDATERHTTIGASFRFSQHVEG